MGGVYTGYETALCYQEDRTGRDSLEIGLSDDQGPGNQVLRNAAIQRFNTFIPQRRTNQGITSLGHVSVNV